MWCRRLRIQRCHYHGTGLIPGPGTFACCGHAQNNLKKNNNNNGRREGRWEEGRKKKKVAKIQSKPPDAQQKVTLGLEWEDTHRVVGNAEGPLQAACPRRSCWCCSSCPSCPGWHAHCPRSCHSLSWSLNKTSRHSASQASGSSRLQGGRRAIFH